MKRSMICVLAAAIMSALLAVSCHQDRLVYKDATADINDRIEDLLSRMTLHEKIMQMNQYMVGVNDNVNNVGEVYDKVPAELGSVIYIRDDAELRNLIQKNAMENSRLGIPLIFGYDVIHGFRTIYQIPLGQAASWNTDLARRCNEVAAKESFHAGVDWTFSPMVDIARDGRWGRISEGYGEDPYTAARFCVAAVEGYQGDDLSAEGTIAACLKHYVGYGASEAGRDYVPTEISRQSLWDTYLPPFEAGVKAGAATLMSSFNTISGIPATANHYTMTEVLKERWGHDGFVVSDWDAIKQLINQGVAQDHKEAARLAVNAGVEMDMVDNLYRRNLEALVEEGAVSEKHIDECVRRILRVKFRLGLFERPYIEELPDSLRLMKEEYLEVSEEMGQESAVLLKNDDGVLPLALQKSIALIGPVARSGNPLLGRWAGRGREGEVVTIYDGMKQEFGPGVHVSYAKGCDFEGNDKSGFAEAVRVASKSDVIVLCLGEKKEWSGENASRSTIALPAIQQELLKTISMVGKPVVLVLSSGRPVDLSSMEPLADAILETWQPGTMGGHSVAGLLSGRYNPSGKLPVTFPYTTGQIPIYYNRRQSGRHHQGFYQDIQSTPMYEFGHGLSYTTFEYGPIILSSDEISRDERVTASVTVTNTGKVAGKEAVLWFVSDPYCSIARPVKELKYFEKQLLDPGESRVFTFEIEPLRDLGFVDHEGNRFIESGEYRLMTGGQTIKLTVK